MPGTDPKTLQPQAIVVETSSLLLLEQASV